MQYVWSENNYKKIDLASGKAPSLAQIFTSMGIHLKNRWPSWRADNMDLQGRR